MPGFHLVTDVPSLAAALGPGPVTRIPPSPSEPPRDLARRLVAIPGLEGILVDLGLGGGLLYGLEVAEELIVHGPEGLLVAALTCLPGPALQECCQLAADGGSPLHGFFERLRQSGCPWPDAGLLRIPVVRESFAAKLAELPAWWKRNAKSVGRWRRRIARDRLEDENRRLRHSLGSADGPRAVARLLLGALTSEASILSLPRCCGVLSTALGEGASRIVEALQGESYASLLAAATGVPKPESPLQASHLPALDVLLVDDDRAAARVWRAGLQALLESLRRGKNRLAATVSVRTVSPAEVHGVAEEPDVVLLDYDLGMGTNVEQVLSSLKSCWAACPVVLFTRCDHVRVADWALSSGCSAVLLKEPADERERSSNAHFRRLAELLLSLDGINGCYRGLWSRNHLVRRAVQQYSTHTSRIQAWDALLAEHANEPRGSIAHQLCTALFALLVPAGRRDASADPWREPCAALLRAEELIQVACAYAGGKTRGQVFGSDEWRAQACWEALKRGGLIELSADVSRRLTGPRPDWEARMGHAAGTAVPVGLHDRLMPVLDRTMVVLAAAAGAPDAADRDPRRRLPVPSAPLPQTSDARHQTTSRLGALELVRSVCPQAVASRAGMSLGQTLANVLQSGAGPRELGDGGALRGRRLWLVDDETDGDYSACLRLLLEACGCQVLSFRYPEQRQALSGAAREGALEPDLVLIDLNMPRASCPDASPEGGLVAIREVRSSLSAAVPVAVLTGSADSLRLADCLAAGVQDYIPKRNVTATAEQGRRGLFERLGRLVGYGRYIASLRKLCEDGSLSGGLPSLEEALLAAQFAGWPGRVTSAMARWGRPEADDWQACALHACLAQATAAAEALVDAAAVAAPLACRPMQRPGEWVWPLLRPQAGDDPARRLVTQAMVALGNLFEPLVTFLLAALGGPFPPGRGRGFASRLKCLQPHLGTCRNHLARTGHREEAGLLEVWIGIAQNAYQRRNAWEHAKQASSDASVPDPVRAAGILRESFTAASGLARAGKVMCEWRL